MKNFFSSNTENTGTSISSESVENLTLDKIKEVMKILENTSRTPVFYCFHYIDKIYKGKLVDKVLTNQLPFFDPRFNEGFMIPISMREYVEKFFGPRAIIV